MADDPATPSPRPRGRAATRRMFDDGRRTRAMRWVMAIMLFLTVLAAALGLATLHAGTSLDGQLAGRLTVQVLRADDAAVARIVDRVRSVGGVRTVAAVPRAEMAELLRPWLGDAGLDPDLPMPSMIDVDLADGSDATAARAAAGIRAVATGALVTRNARWLSPVRDFIASISWFAGGLVLLMATATSAIVLLTARSGLDTHRDTIAVLHMLGSTDGQVARLFQRRIALDTLTGGAIGAVVAAGAVVLIGGCVAALDSAVTGGATLAALDWALLALLPLVFALLATIAARVAVLGALRRVL